MKYIVLKALVSLSFKIRLPNHQQVNAVLRQKGKIDQCCLIVKIKRFWKRIHSPSCVLQFFWWLRRTKSLRYS